MKLSEEILADYILRRLKKEIIEETNTEITEEIDKKLKDIIDCWIYYLYIEYDGTDNHEWDDEKKHDEYILTNIKINNNNIEYVYLSWAESNIIHFYIKPSNLTREEWMSELIICVGDFDFDYDKNIKDESIFSSYPELTEGLEEHFDLSCDNDYTNYEQNNIIRVQYGGKNFSYDKELECIIIQEYIPYI